MGEAQKMGSKEIMYNVRFDSMLKILYNYGAV